MATDHELPNQPRTRRDLEVVEVCGEIVIWDPDANRVHRLDPLGSAIWPLLDGESTIDDLVGDVAEVWEISQIEADGAVRAFVQSLAERLLFKE